MSRLKGRRPLPVQLDHYHDRHPVARCIAEGDHWFFAWLMQKSTPLVSLARITGIPMQRLATIRPGVEVSRAEVDAFARAWSVSSHDLIRSIGDANPIVD